MQDNDARLTRAYTAITGSAVQEDIPNQSDAGEPADPNFDLFVEAAAGNAIGTTGEPYTLTITGVNVTKQVVVAQLTSAAGQAFNAANGWSTSGDDFVKTQRITFPLPLPAPSAPRDLYRFYVSLVSDNGQIASFTESNQFMLV